MKKYVTCVAFNESLTRTVVLTKNDKIKFLAGKTMPPGGSVEEGETSYVAAAREFEEECGISTSDLVWGFVGTIYVSVDGEIVSQCDYMRTYLPDDVLETARTMEAEEIRVVDLASLNVMNTDADIMCMITAAFSNGCDDITVPSVTRHLHR